MNRVQSRPSGGFATSRQGNRAAQAGMEHFLPAATIPPVFKMKSPPAIVPTTRGEETPHEQ